MTLSRRLLALATTLATLSVVLWPSIALACPVCAADQKQNVLKVVAAFLAVPFLVVGIVVPAIRRAIRSAE